MPQCGIYATVERVHPQHPIVTIFVTPDKFCHLSQLLKIPIPRLALTYT